MAFVKQRNMIDSVQSRDGLWTKVSDLREGQEIAVAGSSNEGAWDKIVKIESLPAEDVYDIEIEGTHNFIAGHYVNARTKQALSPEQEERYAQYLRKANGLTLLFGDQNNQGNRDHEQGAQDVKGSHSIGYVTNSYLLMTN